MTGSWVKVGESWGLRGRRKRTRAAMFAVRVDGGERYPDQLRGGPGLSRPMSGLR